jgi:hypothetical protein
LLRGERGEPPLDLRRQPPGADLFDGDDVPRPRLLPVETPPDAVTGPIDALDDDAGNSGPGGGGDADEDNSGPSSNSGSGSSGSGSRAFATAARASGVAFRGGREELQRYERMVGITVSAGLLGTALLGARFPRLLAWPLAAASGLVGTAGLLRTLRPADSKERRDAGER